MTFRFYPMVKSKVQDEMKKMVNSDGRVYTKMMALSKLNKSLIKRLSSMKVSTMINSKSFTVNGGWMSKILNRNSL